MADIRENPVREACLQRLEVECSDCDGSGVQAFKGAVFHCETCEGKGSKPTEFGKDVLRFLAKFGCEATS